MVWCVLGLDRWGCCAVTACYGAGFSFHFLSSEEVLTLTGMMPSLERKLRCGFSCQLTGTNHPWCMHPSSVDTRALNVLP